ncbi:RDD family protein [Lysobacter auxotrophicus]|uniref:RDD family protein n=1 Tax=Lysobacter auxotrophicus TaxID=2992573 RepID=A0ABM8D9A5_9GAMM|nr:RDD family protein [Lysobacter auxotrophicus]BDU15137.1 RDD family protein [Lysobacter auxotrophicus]
MTDWYYHLPGQGRVGPLGADDVREAYRAGRVQRDTLAWHVGARDWLPLDRFFESLGLDAAVAPPPAAYAAPAVAADGLDDRASPYAPPRAALSEAGDYHVAAGEIVYAGFWKRLAALMIDALVVTVAYYVILVVAMIAFGIGMAGTFSSETSSPAGIAALLAVIYLTYPVVSGLYYVTLESSSTQATLGKMAVGIKVTDDTGRRLGRGRALGRWASHLLCYLTLYIGYFMAGFTDRKRGLHDMVASTLVVDRWAYTAQPDRQRRGLGTVALVLLVLGGLAAVAYVGVMFAIAVPAYQEYVRRAAGGG